MSPRSNNYEFSVRSCFFDTPPPPHKAMGIPPRRGGGSKRRQFPRGWGIAYRGFFPGGLGKIGELFINNSFSVEQPISYFAVTGDSKQVLLFALIIFHLRSAKCFFFFHSLRDRFLSYNCHRLKKKLPVI